MSTLGQKPPEPAGGSFHSYMPADADYLLLWGQVAFRLIDDPCPEDGTDFSSHAAGASSDIPGCGRRSVVVAGHTDQFGAGADRSERQTAVHIIRPFPRPPDITVAGDAGVAGTNRGRSRPACQNIRLHPYLCDRSGSRSDSRTCGQGGAESHSGNLAR